MENLVSNAVEEKAGYEEINILFQDVSKKFIAATATGFSPVLLPEGIFCFCLVFFLYSIQKRLGEWLNNWESCKWICGV